MSNFMIAVGGSGAKLLNSLIHLSAAGLLPDNRLELGALLVDPDDVPALANALRCLLGDPAERARLTAATRAAAGRLPTWEQTADLFARAIERASGRVLT